MARSRRIMVFAALIIAVSLIEKGMSAQQKRSQTAKETKADVLKNKLDKGEKILLIDVRSEDEVKAGSIPGAINLPMDQLEARMKDIPKDVQIVFVCDHSNRSSLAAELFEKNGYSAATFCVLEDWKAMGNKTGETKKPAAGRIGPL